MRPGVRRVAFQQRSLVQSLRLHFEFNIKSNDCASGNIPEWSGDTIC